MSGIYLNMNAWQEIQARIFEGFTIQSNVSPAWLINPATRRKLKLDRLYPEAAIAVRNVGLTAKGQGRQSDWELLEEQQRDSAVPRGQRPVHCVRAEDYLRLRPVDAIRREQVVIFQSHLLPLS